MRALKSPNEEEVKVPVDLADNPDEDEMDSEEDDKRSCYEPRVWSSEESPNSCQRRKRKRKILESQVQ